MNDCGLPVVLIAEDDLGDWALLEQAFRATNFEADLRFTANGEEFLAYLRREPPWENAERPDLITLDLSMPRMDGREVLGAINRAPEWRAVPVVVFTTSRAPQDVEMATIAGPTPISQSRMAWASWRRSSGRCASSGLGSRCFQGRSARRRGKASERCLNHVGLWCARV